MPIFSRLTNETIDIIVKEYQRAENQEKIKMFIIDPIIYYILDCLYPYIFITAALFILILLTTLLTFVVLLKSSKNKND